jgi:hypothetical protein
MVEASIIREGLACTISFDHSELVVSYFLKGKQTKDLPFEVTKARNDHETIERLISIVPLLVKKCTTFLHQADVPAVPGNSFYRRTQQQLDAFIPRQS